MGYTVKPCLKNEKIKVLYCFSSLTLYNANYSKLTSMEKKSNLFIQNTIYKWVNQTKFFLQRIKFRYISDSRPFWPDMVTHTYNPSTQEVELGGSQPGLHNNLEFFWSLISKATSTYFLSSPPFPLYLEINFLCIFLLLLLIQMDIHVHCSATSSLNDITKFDPYLTFAPFITF